MKKLVSSLSFALVGLFVTGITGIAVASVGMEASVEEVNIHQRAGEDKGIYIFYPKKQKPAPDSDVIVDAVAFAPDRTVVTLYSARTDAMGARINPETILRCYIRGGEVIELAFRKATGISATSEFQQLHLGMSFTIYFPAIDPALISQVVKVDFIEDVTGERPYQFNIFDILLSRKRMIVK